MMMKQKKFLKLVNPKHDYYSHEDQEVHGLQFRVFYCDVEMALFLIQGGEKEIRDYILRYNVNIKELSDGQMKLEIEKQIKPGQKPCDFCRGTGSLIIPDFDPIEEKEEICNGNNKKDRGSETRSL